MVEQMEVRPLISEDFPFWNALVADSAEGTIYHDTRWLSAVCRATRDSWLVYGAFQDTELVAGVPLAIRSKGPFSIARRAFATPYASIVVAKNFENSQAVLAAKLADATRAQHSLTTLAFPPNASEALFPVHWSTRKRHTYVHNITDSAAFWSSIASGARNKVRKAEKAGIQIEKNTSAEAFDALYRDTFSRQGRELPFNTASLIQLLDDLVVSGIGSYYVSKLPDGSPCACALFVWDKRSVYYSLAGSDEQLKKTGAPSLLVWRAVQEMPCTMLHFDLGGANIPAITRFKKKFRGVLKDYVEFSAYRSTGERCLLAAREAVQTLKSRIHG